MTWLDDLTKVAHQSVEEVAELLNARGVSDAQIQDYQVGYIPDNIPALEYPENFLRWSHDGKKLKGMYLFPLTNPIGEIRGFQFRPIDREVRGYSDFILESGEPISFGLAQAMPHIWSSRTVTLVEGVFDLFPIQRLFRPGVVTTLSLHITDELFRTLTRLLCGRKSDVMGEVVIGFDNDGPGQRAYTQFVKQNFDLFRIGRLQYPRRPMHNGKDTKDPGDLWEIWGDQEMRQQLPLCIKLDPPRPSGWRSSSRAGVSMRSQE